MKNLQATVSHTPTCPCSDSAGIDAGIYDDGPVCECGVLALQKATLLATRNAPATVKEAKQRLVEHLQVLTPEELADVLARIPVTRQLQEDADRFVRLAHASKGRATFRRGAWGGWAYNNPRYEITVPVPEHCVDRDKEALTMSFRDAVDNLPEHEVTDDDE